MARRGRKKSVYRSKGKKANGRALSLRADVKDYMTFFTAFEDVLVAYGTTAQVVPESDNLVDIIRAIDSNESFFSQGFWDNVVMGAYSSFSNLYNVLLSQMFLVDDNITQQDIDNTNDDLPF